MLGNGFFLEKTAHELCSFYVWYFRGGWIIPAKNFLSPTCKDRGEFGGALLIVLILIIILTFLGSSFELVSTNECMQSTRHAQRIQAYYLARSGAEVMRDCLNADEYLTSEPAADGSFRFAGSLLPNAGLEAVEVFDPNPQPIQISVAETATGYVILSTGQAGIESLFG